MALGISLVSQIETPPPEPEPTATVTVTATPVPEPEPTPEPAPVEDSEPPFSLDNGRDALLFYGLGMLVLTGGVLIGRDL